ncbi:MAG TPA: anti-sigma factor [Acidimicrobiia bacterium]|nr:anti-sigma factor [Acidimicrobiia bacterium]
MNCQDARTEMLAGGSSGALEGHLSGCRSCRSEQAAWARARVELSGSGLWEEPPPDLGARIERLLRDGKDEESTAKGGVGWLPVVAAAVLVVALGAVSWWRQGVPDWELVMASTVEAENGTAVVQGWLTGQGTRMVLDISGIQEALPGTYYEIWLTAPDGRHVSAGTFRGPGRVTAFAAVRRADFPRIWITLEEVDSDLGPSRETYFDTA